MMLVSTSPTMGASILPFLLRSAFSLNTLLLLGKPFYAGLRRQQSGPTHNHVVLQHVWAWPQKDVERFVPPGCWCPQEALPVPQSYTLSITQLSITSMASWIGQLYHTSESTSLWSEDAG